MANIVILTSGLTGIMNASYELGNRLRSAGHEVTLAAPRRIAAKVNVQGFNFFQLPEVIEPFQVQKQSGNRWSRLWQRWVVRKADQARADAYYHQSGLPELTEQLQPELCLIDVELHAQIFIAHGLGLNFLLLSQWYTLVDFPGLPYLLSDLIPNTDYRSSKLGLRWQWWKIRIQRYWMFQKIRLRSFGTDRRSSLNRLAKKQNFPQRHIRKNFWPGPFTYIDFPVLSMAPREMEFPYPKPDWQHYIGPMVYAQRVETMANSLNGYSVEQIVKQKSAKNKRLLVCTVTTMRASDQSFLKKLCTAVAGHPDWLLVLAAGQQASGLPNADNIFPFDYLPQLTCLSRADLSINHGGIHTIHECIHFGVPMLVYHGKKSDQPGCAARVHYHGIGIMADKDADAPEQIKQKIATILDNPMYKRKMELIQENIQYYRSEKKLERLIQYHITLN